MQGGTMPKFSKSSSDKLNTCNPKLVKLFNEVVKHYDCTIICGHRGEEIQNQVFREGRSKLKFPNSKHNGFPSNAVDVAPYHKESPHIRWNDHKDFILFAGFVKGVASMLDIKIRWGGDWDSDWDMTDQTFIDLPHFEILD